MPRPGPLVRILAKTGGLGNFFAHLDPKTSGQALINLSTALTRLLDPLAAILNFTSRIMSTGFFEVRATPKWIEALPLPLAVVPGLALGQSHGDQSITALLGPPVMAALASCRVAVGCEHADGTHPVD
jgi:hypothetical protein